MAPGHTTELDWHGRPVLAWVPDPLGAGLAVDDTTLTAARTALAAVVRADAALPAQWESLARILLRTEGIASSSVEGITAPVAEVFAAELEPGADHDASWIADNLAVVDVAQAAGGPLTDEQLHEWHRRLLRHGYLPDDLVGRYRTSPGWIGGTSPANAAYVPPPADLVPDLMADLVDYASREDVLDPVVQAAVVHAQFETIHPYGDGNGRLGRVLVGWVLARRLGLERVVPPISVLIARDPGGYLSGLWQFREGSLDEWIRWFASIVERAAGATTEVAAEIEALASAWHDRTSGLRADSSARAALDVLVAHPVLTAAVLARELDVSTRSARTALHTLADLGMVEPYEPQR
ncbi:MAG: Fic family protein, partial [Acidimicrobiia bacterium]|nr:Fic family protein [Acidimicrobiia bacterium]